MGQSINRNLNLPQRVYKQHLPEIVNSTLDPVTEKYYLPNPFNGGKNQIEIDSAGFFKAENPPISGTIFDFFVEAEGIEKETSIKLCEDYIEGKYPPSIQEIKIWHDDLFCPEAKGLYDYLTIRRGLYDATIREYLLGYKRDTNEFVIPALNITKENPIAVLYLSFDENESKFTLDCRFDGVECLFGYHKLAFKPQKNIPKYITFDIIDCLYLRQLGLDSYVGFNDIYSMSEGWGWLFSNCNVRFLGNLRISVENGCAANFFNTTGSQKIINLKSEFVSDYFVKSGKTISDFNELVSSTNKVNDELIKSYLNLKNTKFQVDNVKYIDAPQGYTSNKGLIYGAYFGGKYYFLGNRFYYDEVGMSEYEIYKKSEFSFHNITQELINALINDNKTVLAHNVFNAIKRHIKKYIFLKESEYYDLLSIWTMGTYLFTIFRYYPYIHIQAEKNSGKSTLMSILEKICFNGKLYVDTTDAVIFREADVLKRTMFFDEAEDYSKRKSRGNLMELLNSGFQKDGVVSRTASNRDGGTKDYNVYCPKVFAGINEINDVLQSRSIQINMVRKLSTENLQNYRNDNKNLRAAELLRNDLYLFGLLYATEVNEIYETEKVRFEFLQNLQNREFDIWNPMFIIAYLIDNSSKKSDASESLKKLITLQKEIQNSKNLVENTLAMFLSKLDEILNQIEPVKIDNTAEPIIVKYLKIDVYDEFKKDVNMRSKFTTQNKLSSQLAKCGIKSSNEYIEGKTNNPCYAIDIVNLYEHGSRYDVSFTFADKFKSSQSDDDETKVE